MLYERNDSKVLIHHVPIVKKFVCETEMNDWMEQNRKSIGGIIDIRFTNCEMFVIYKKK